MVDLGISTLGSCVNWFAKSAWGTLMLDDILVYRYHPTIRNEFLTYPVEQELDLLMHMVIDQYLDLSYPQAHWPVSCLRNLHVWAAPREHVVGREWVAQKWFQDTFSTRDNTKTVLHSWSSNANRRICTRLPGTYALSSLRVLRSRSLGWIRACLHNMFLKTLALQYPARVL